MDGKVLLSRRYWLLILVIFIYPPATNDLSFLLHLLEALKLFEIEIGALFICHQVASDDIRWFAGFLDQGLALNRLFLGLFDRISDPLGLSSKLKELNFLRTEILRIVA